MFSPGMSGGESAVLLLGEDTASLGAMEGIAGLALDAAAGSGAVGVDGRFGGGGRLMAWGFT